MSGTERLGRADYYYPYNQRDAITHFNFAQGIPSVLLRAPYITCSPPSLNSSFRENLVQTRNIEIYTRLTFVDPLTWYKANSPGSLTCNTVPFLLLPVLPYICQINMHNSRPDSGKFLTTNHAADHPRRWL